MSVRRVTFFVVLATLLAPAAGAAWAVKGSWEPDTKADRLDGWMFQNPDVAPTVNKVYLNGFFGQCTFPCYTPLTSENVNIATGRTMMSTTMMYSYAMFGVWKDCNRDGYVGLGDQGLMEYRAELLIDTGICKPQSVPVTAPWGNPPVGWTPVHNDGVWIHELFPIGGDDVDEVINRDFNPWNLNDGEARVWMDFGTPGASRDPGAAGCYINPQPVGTYRSTGGTFEYVDCQLRWRVTDLLNSILVPNGADSTPLGQVSFSDKPRDQSESRSILNQKNPWGSDSDNAYADVWDCSADTTSIDANQSQLSGGAVQGSTHVTNVSQPGVPRPHADGSASGTMNMTVSGTDECHRSTKDSSTARTTANLPYTNEGTSGTRAPGKQKADQTLGPAGGTRPSAPLARFLGASTPPDLGARFIGDDGLWRGGDILAGNFFVDAAGARANPVTYVTTYATVSAANASKYNLIFSKPVGAAYGYEACAGAQSGIVKGWDCSALNWPGGVKVGQLYRARDVDCYDGSFDQAREAGVHWGIVTGTACQR